MGKASRSKAERRRLRGEARTPAPADRPDRWAPLASPAPPGDFPGPVGLGALLLLALVGAGYYPALMAGFVWDDIIFYSASPVQEWSGLWDIWTRPTSLELEGHYWPVVYSSFWLEHKIWGLEPAGYHATNLLLQGINTLLVWRLMLRLAVPGAWLIAAVFAVHPLHVESVAWVIERKDLLSGLFYLCATLAWLRFLEVPGRSRYAATMGLFVASLLSKTVTVTFPAALLVLHWWKHGRVMARDLLRLLPFFAVGLAIAVGDVLYYNTREPLDLDYSFPERLMIASQALWFYVGKLLWPTELAVIYPFWEVGAGHALGWLAFAAVLALAGGLWLARGRIGRGPLAAALFFGVTLSPVLGFVDYGYMQFSFAADRFQYLAGLGVMAGMIGAAVHAARRWPAPVQKGAWGLAALVLAVMVVRSAEQSRVYHDELVLFSHVIAHNPEARDAHYNLGATLLDAGRTAEALEVTRIAVQQRPDFAGAYANLGLALLRRGEFEEAEAVLRRGYQIDPRNTAILQNLGEVVRRKGRPGESLQWYAAVFQVDRDHALAYLGKGDALFQLQRYEEALAHLRRALALDLNLPEKPLIHTLVGEAAQKLERFEEARQHFDTALALDPDLGRAHAGLLGLLLTGQQEEEARRYLQTLRARRPASAPTLHGVAEFFRERQNYERALEWYAEALRADPGFTQAHAGQGDALFQLQRYEEAIASLSRAVDLEPSMPTVPALRTLMGRAMQALDRREAAAEQYQRILAEHPDRFTAIDRLALVRYEQGRHEEALELYRRLLALDPDSANTYANIGIIYYHTGRIEQARSSLERALELDPDTEMAQVVLELIRKGAD